MEDDSKPQVLSSKQFHSLKLYAYQPPERREEREPSQEEQRRRRKIREFNKRHGIEHPEVCNIIDEIARERTMMNTSNQTIQQLLEDLSPFAPDDADTAPPYNY